MKTKRSKSFSFYRFLKKYDSKSFTGNTILFYEGDVKHEITKSLTYTAEKHLMENNASRIVQKKVFNVLVECLQNIDKHAEALEVDFPLRKRGAVLVSEFDDHYYVFSANPAEKASQSKLIQAIDNINVKKKDELRQFYKKQLYEGCLSEKGGAGLGFIDMARKSGNPIDYSFAPFSKEFVILLLKFCVSKS